MGVAYKCDRCGKLFDGFQEHKSTINRSVINAIQVKTAAFTSNPIELCKKCADDLGFWFNNPQLIFTYLGPPMSDEENETAIDVHNITTTGNPVRLPEVITTSETPPKIVY